MRILIDTNVLFSALVFPNSKPAKALLYIADNYNIVLCEQNLREIREVIQRKAPKFLPATEALLTELSYELIPSIHQIEKAMRDETDQPILNAAILYDIDIILTGDKDFLALEIDRPKCMTAAQFLELEGIV